MVRDSLPSRLMACALLAIPFGVPAAIYAPSALMWRLICPRTYPWYAPYLFFHVYYVSITALIVGAPWDGYAILLVMTWPSTFAVCLLGEFATERFYETLSPTDRRASGAAQEPQKTDP